MRHIRGTYALLSASFLDSPAARHALREGVVSDRRGLPGRVVGARA